MNTKIVNVAEGSSGAVGAMNRRSGHLVEAETAGPDRQKWSAQRGPNPLTLMGLDRS